MCLGLVHAQSLHEPAILLGCEQSGLCCEPRPLETAGLQTFVKKDKPIALSIQCLDPVSASAAEQEQGVAEWIQVKGLLYHGSQTIYSTAQICVAAGNVDLVGPGKVAQHDFSSRSTMPTVSASAPL